MFDNFVYELLTHHRDLSSNSTHGRAQLDFRESPQDIENLRQCFLLAARGFLTFGARRVFLPMLRPPKIERESDLKQIEKMKYGIKYLPAPFPTRRDPNCPDRRRPRMCSAKIASASDQALSPGAPRRKAE